MASRLRMGIALGSNLGDRLGHLRAAFSWLKTQSEGPVLYSRIYETAPISCAEDAPSFLNAVCEIVCNCDPIPWLRRMRQFEQSRGRPPQYARNAPRCLDLDLLYAGNWRMQTEELTLPHPRIAERRFVLQPLSEIRPDLILPNQTRTVSQLLAGLQESQEICLIDESLESEDSSRKET